MEPDTVRRRIRELEFMVPEFVARTGGSNRVQAQPAGSNRVQAQPAGSNRQSALPTGSRWVQAQPAYSQSIMPLSERKAS